MPGKAAAEEEWGARWLDWVKSSGSTMSQRKLSSVEARGGGLPMVRRLARERGVHILQLEDDEGNQLLAASMNPFKVIC